VHVLATAVDTERYRPAEARPEAEVKRICWAGGSSNFRYLKMIAPALRAFFEKRRDVVLRVIADQPLDLEGIAADRIEFIPWSPEIEVRAIQESSIGVMPLEDTPWARGKCSFKLLTYMACGVPVVASPVGMNAAVLAAGGGLAPKRWGEWADALEYLLEDGAAAERMAKRCRQAAIHHYSVKALAPELARILWNCRN
jgi:glycosyltransferase involved in cell wall biosynthesis